MSAAAPRPLSREERVQRWCFAVLVGTLAWFVAPGRIVPDTKIDLVLSPWRYLGRAVDAWNTHTGLGELQNQAYGYLFPMGPVFGVTHSLGMPAWASQRLWWSLLLVVAFLGAERLARDLGMARFPVSVLAGVAYALSPRVLTVLSEISVEAWPGALAPWLVLAVIPALRPGANGADRRRAGLRTGLLCAVLGGVNATASAAVVALPLIYLCTAPRGRARLRTGLWWAGGVVLGSAWWVLPLLVLGRYAYPFMDYIESAATTTAVTSVSNVLRGASHWVAYILTSADNPVWQSGWVLAQTVTAIIATCLLAGLGLAGLVRSPSRPGHAARFLVLSAISATVFMAIGHDGTATGPLSTAVQGLLDGALSPLRNIHKADPLLRLPVALGLAALVTWLLEKARVATSRWSDPRVAMSAAVVVGLALAGSLLPIWQGRVGDAWSFEKVPSTWRTMAELTDRAAETTGGATLLLPGSRFADYSWGKPSDEPLSALATSPVLVRASAPLGHPGATRLLDEIDRLATSGTEQASLAQTLRQLGVARVVLRRDLAPAAQAEPAALVESTLDSSPGLTHVANVGSGSQMLSLYEVSGTAQPLVQAYAASSALAVTGGAEAATELLNAALLPTSVVTVPVGETRDGALVATDTERLRAFNAGRPTALAYGPTTTLDDPAVGSGSRPDLAITESPEQRPHLRLFGLTGLRATSSTADPFSRHPLGPATGPAAAIDADPTTRWVPGGAEDRPALTLDFGTDVTLRRIEVAAAMDEQTARVGVLRLHAGSSVQDVQLDSTGHGHIDVGGVSARSLTLEPIKSDSTDPRPPSVAGVVIDGHPMSAVITVPVGGASSAVLARDTLSRLPDARAGEDPATWSRLLVGSASSATPEVSALLRPRWGSALDNVLDGSARVQGSSRADLSPAHRPGAALDADPTTQWQPMATDRRPTLTVTVPAGVRLTTAELGNESAATVTLSAAARRTVTLTPGGQTDVSALAGAPTVQVTYYDLPPGSPAPDVILSGLPRADGALHVTCADPTQVRIGKRTVPFAGTWSAEQVRTGATVPGTPCPETTTATSATDNGGLPLRMSATALATIEQVRLQWVRLPTAQPSDRVASMSADGPGRIAASVRSGAPAYLALSQGFNAGWQARTSTGRTLTPILLDGWRQGFVLPADTSGRVDIAFAPDRAYRMGLLLGAILSLALLVGAAADAVVGRRRASGSEGLAWAASADDPAEQRRAPHWGSRLLGAAAVLVTGGLLAGVVGLAAGFVALAVPRRWRAGGLVAALAIAGVAMAALGVADRQSAGALAGQAFGTVVVCLLVRALSDPSAAAGHAPSESVPAPE